MLWRRGVVYFQSFHVVLWKPSNFLDRCVHTLSRQQAYSKTESAELLFTILFFWIKKHSLKQMALQLQKNNKQSLCVSFHYNLKGIEVKSYPAPAYRINTKLFRQHKVRNLGRWTDNREKAKHRWKQSGEWVPVKCELVSSLGWTTQFNFLAVERGARSPKRWILLFFQIMLRMMDTTKGGDMLYL